MKRALAKRCLTGFFCGVAADYIIAIIASCALDLGYFMPCVAAMPEIFGGELRAVVVQALAFGLSGCMAAQAAHAQRDGGRSRIFRTALFAALSLLPIAAIAAVLSLNS